ncbi:MAG: gliding motility-associated C-terminal domain-containing protein [Cytophagales bacterium]|nr:gliding motility-associated C-terminal domain-containing protein [Cytophagales bacterium]MDW8385157.1 gliding motility-associated C-terminal domain-containing protein [Flammeovirgaceae bacterium]
MNTKARCIAIGYCFTILSGFLQARILTVTNPFDGGAGSLRRTIIDARYSDTIIFLPQIDSVVILFAPLFFNQNKRLTIDGGQKGCKIVGLTGDAVFIAHQQSDTLRFKNLVWCGARKPNLVKKSKLYVEHCDFYDHTGGSGAAIFPDTSDILAVNCSFRHNRAFGLQESPLKGEGAAITGHKSFVKLINCTFYDNVAGQGGALAADNGTNYEIIHCTFAYNAGTVNNGKKLGNGGAILANGDTIRLYNSILVENADNQIAKIPGFVLGSHNLIQQDSNFTAFQIRKKAGLAPLQTDGIVWFFPLQIGSPAIDAASEDFSCNTDIRGHIRKKPDLGSFEFALCESSNLSAIPIEDSVCEPTQIRLMPQIGVYQPYITSVSAQNQEEIDCHLQELIIRKPQIFKTYENLLTIRLQNNSQACSYTQSIKIKVFPQPPKRLPDTAFFCPDVEPSVLLDVFRPDSTLERYTWSHTHQLKTNVSVNQEGTYTVDIRNKYGCHRRETIKVVELCETQTWFPSAFFPESSIDEHQTFKPIKTALKNYQLIIFNRWGEIIFSTSNPKEGWDGTYNGVLLPEGTYIFHAYWQSEQTNKLQYIQGSVFLVR